MYVTTWQSHFRSCLSTVLQTKFTRMHEVALHMCRSVAEIKSLQKSSLDGAIDEICKSVWGGIKSGRGYGRDGAISKGISQRCSRRIFTTTYEVAALHWDEGIAEMKPLQMTSLCGAMENVRERWAGSSSQRVNGPEDAVGIHVISRRPEKGNLYQVTMVVLERIHSAHRDVVAIRIVSQRQCKLGIVIEYLVEL